MSKNNGKVQHFEIPVGDLLRAKNFYSKVFDWKLVDFKGGDMDYTMAYTTEVDETTHMSKEAGAINGGMFQRKDEIPVTAPTVAITVDDINATLEKIKSQGGTILNAPMKVGNMGLYSYVKDTEGNIIGVWQNTEKPAM